MITVKICKGLYTTAERCILPYSKFQATHDEPEPHPTLEFRRGVVRYIDSSQLERIRSRTGRTYVCVSCSFFILKKCGSG